MQFGEEDNLRWTYTPTYYSETTIPPPLGPISVIRDIFNTYIELAKVSGQCNTVSQWLDIDLGQVLPIKNRIERYINSLEPRIEQLKIESFDLTAFYVLQTLRASFQILNLDFQLMQSVRKVISQFTISKVVNPLLKKVITMKKVDEDLAMSLLLWIGPGCKEDWLRNNIREYRMDIDKFSTIMTLGLRCATLFNFDEQYTRGYRELKLKCKWWLKCFSKILKYVEHFQMSFSNLALSLISSNEISLTLLQEFCNDFSHMASQVNHIDIQEYLLLYLNNIFFSWKPKIEVVTIKNTRNIIVKNCEKELFKTCVEIIELINDKGLIFQELQKIWDQVSYYSYEIYLCLLQLLQMLDPKYEKTNDMLLFLKKYTRICKPQQREIEEWEMNFPQLNKLDPLSEFRLPYLPEVYRTDVWKILKPEINLDTYIKWFDAANILNLDKNDICTYAIKGTVAAGKYSFIFIIINFRGCFSALFTVLSH